MRALKLKVGDWVQVRSKEEILATLDASGELDHMPFMPEMLAFCGQRFRVHRRAHKTCDTVFPTRSRRVDRAVHLETRCDGSAHGGCQAGCLIFWKEAWLKPLDDPPGPEPPALLASGPEPESATTRSSPDECTVWARAKVADPADGTAVYTCQATRLPEATKPLAWWDPRQYAEDYFSGNVTMWQVLCGFVYSVYYNISQAGIGVGSAMEWFYNTFHRLWRGTPFPRSTGAIPVGQPTPTDSLDLRPGELVRVKPYRDILQTLNTDRQNRGLSWDAELVPYCGGTYRVLRRVTDIIDERTGRMQHFKSPSIILDTVVCQAKYSGCRMFCPRGIYPFWREIWLERP